MANIYKEIQKQIDDLGYINKELSTSDATVGVIPPIGKNEYEIVRTFYPSRSRSLRYLEYEDMNINSAEISSALDIYADDATKRDEQGNIITVRCNNQQVKEEIEQLLYNNLAINTTAWSILRSMCMYGDHFMEVILYEDNRGVAYLKPLPPYTMWRIEENGVLKAFIQSSAGGQVIFQPWQIIHWRLTSTMSKYLPYGTSVLEPIRRTWRLMRYLEDAMAVYRISRAPERRVFKIPVGNMPPDEAIKYVRKIMTNFRKTKRIDFNSALSYKVNAMPPDEDFFIPVRNGESVDIETLGGADNLGEIDDVKYFRDKIFAALKVPRIFLQDTEGIDERKQNVSQQDLMFARTIERIQLHFLEGLKKVIYIHLILRGYKPQVLDDIELRMTPPSYLEELMRYELYDQRASAINTLVDIGLPKSKLMLDIFGFTEEEWEQLKKARYEERREEEMVDSGEYWEQEEDEEDEEDMFESIVIKEFTKRRSNHRLVFNDLRITGEVTNIEDCITVFEPSEEQRLLKLFEDHKIKYEE